MKKRALSMILALMLLIVLLPILANAATLDSGLVYEVYEDHVEITGYTGSDSTVVIPAEIERLPVTVIGDSAFLFCSKITNIYLPDSITSIEDFAFNECRNLTSIDLPDSITCIPKCAFDGCYNLSSIQIPNSVTSIEDFAFSDCENLASIHLPDGLASIGESVFSFCVNLSSINLPDSLTSIGNTAFYRCNNLKSIGFKGDAPQFGSSAFSQVNATAYYPIGNTTWSEDVMQDYSGDITWVAYDSSHTHDYTPVVTAPTCTEQGFTTYTCSCGESYVIHYVAALDHDYSNIICSRCGWTNDDLQYSVYEDHAEITGYTGSDHILVIPAEIEGVPVTVIADSAFSNCDTLHRVTFPDTLTSIGNSAFLNCDQLSISIPDGITSIGDRAFSNCGMESSISIPASVTSIGYRAFGVCFDLEEIEVDENNPNYSSYDGVLYNKDKTVLIEAPCAITYCRVPDGVTAIREGALMDCFDLTGISLPNSVTSIGDWAFYYCISLTHINIPDSVTSIGDYAFKECNNLTSVDLPDNITRIPEYAFDGCWNLSSIQIPNSVTSIGERAFRGCYSLSSIDIPDGVTSIGVNAFGGCSGLFTLDIPASVTSIGKQAFYGCSGLFFIDIRGNVASIGDEAFAMCSSVYTVHFAGDAPVFGTDVFKVVHANAYYPTGNPTWTIDVMKHYGGRLIWISYFPNNPFSDVPSGSWYEAPVVWALENGITAGTSANTFSPDDQCLRSQVMTFLWNATNKPEPNSYRNPFTDVPAGVWYEKPVLWAVENGITSGISATEFGANDVCSRYQVVFFLWKAAGSPEPTSTYNPFSDVKSTDFFYNAVLWAVENEITAGISPTEFGTYAPCTRAQVMTFLYNAYT